MTKREMRARMKGVLRGIAAPDLAERSGAIAERLAGAEAWAEANTILCFLSMPGEVETAGIIDAARAARKPVGVPRIEGAAIGFRVLPSVSAPLPRDNWGIPEPDPSWPEVDLARAGKVLVVTPGLAFDRQGRRLGRGGGYYDGFLRGVRRNPSLSVRAFGICLSEQVVPEVPTGGHDETLDGIVTDKELILPRSPYYISPGVQQMGVIKSAFEIAMENSKGIEANKELVETNRFRDEGKKLVSKLLEDTSFNIKEALKGYDKRQGAWVREGLIQSLLANLVLPVDEFATKNTKRIGEAVTAVVSDSKKVTMIFSQLDNFFKEYVSERKRVIEAIERQYAPKLKKKEEEMSRQLGRPVKINPAADPEYQSIVRQYLSQLDVKYSEVLEGAKEEIRTVFSKSPA